MRGPRAVWRGGGGVAQGKPEGPPGALPSVCCFDCVQDEVVRREKLGVNGVIRKKDMYGERERSD